MVFKLVAELPAKEHSGLPTVETGVGVVVRGEISKGLYGLFNTGPMRRFVGTFTSIWICIAAASLCLTLSLPSRLASLFSQIQSRTVEYH